MNSKTQWHYGADIVVCGFGAAGAVTAITAREGAAEVLVLEKQVAERFVTTSFMSGGGIICPNDRDGAEQYMQALVKVTDDLYWTDPEIVRVWADYTTQNKRWIENIGGVRMTVYRHGGEHRLPGAEAIDSCHIPGMGPGLMRLLYEQAKIRNVQVVHGLAAEKLLLNERGEVVGVRARKTGGQLVNVRARRAIILTTGGFEFDEQMKLQYLRVYPTYFLGSPANTGDGVRMATDVGAELWHMNCCSARLVMKFPELPYAFSPALGGMNWGSPGGSVLPGAGGVARPQKQGGRATAVAGYIIVDRFGKRYTNENFKGHSIYYELTGFDSQKLVFPRVPSYWIFDRKRLDDSPLALRRSGPAGPAQLYTWGADNREELGRGWIHEGKTIEKLARVLSIEPSILKGTVSSYNESCKEGRDTEFHRQLDSLIPLDTPPFYAVPLWPGGPNTQGGPRKNRKAQVLRSDGSPVRRLYAAGELGSVYGMLYPSGGGNLAECIAFGRIAGEHASGERPV